MKKNKFIHFVHSLAILPIMTMPMVFPGINGFEITRNDASIEKQNIQIEEARIQKAESIDTYFKARKMPLQGMGMKMVLEAEKNDLDWRLLPAIAVRESTGGKNLFAKNNPFGWGKKVEFDSFDTAVEIIAKNLGGNNPKTAHHYDEKTTIEILHAYNPPSIVPRYAEQVIAIMNTIGAPDTEPTAVANT